MLSKVVADACHSLHFGRQLLLTPDDDRFLKAINLLFKCAFVRNNPFSRLRRRLRHRVRHQIRDRLIFLMPNTSNDRNRKLRNRLPNRIVIEYQKVRLGSAAPNNHNSIIFELAVEHIDLPINYMLCIVFSLYQREIIVALEPIEFLVRCPEQVSVHYSAGCRPTDEIYALRMALSCFAENCLLFRLKLANS